jgi:hypothetical protein
MAKKVLFMGLLASARGRSMLLLTGVRSRFRHDSPSSPRFSRWPPKAGFSQINITLDSAQGLVVDHLLLRSSITMSRLNV